MIRNILTAALGAMLTVLIGSASAQEGITTKPILGNQTRTITGCLTTSDDEFVLTADGGGIWQLRGNSVKLDGYAGNTVTITGVILDGEVHGTRVNATREAKDPSVLRDTTGYGHMTVTKLTWLSSTCEKNS
jgi:hypothetical protein